MYLIIRSTILLLFIVCTIPTYALEIKTIQPKELSNYITNDGKIKLLYTITSWCGVCKKTLPEVLELAEEYDPDEFKIFIISLDDNKAALEKTMQSFSKYKGIVLHLENSNVQSLLKGLQSVGITYRGGVPHSTLISPKGEVLVDGNYSLVTIKKGINHLLSEKEQ